MSINSTKNYFLRYFGIWTFKWSFRISNIKSGTQGLLKFKLTLALFVYKTLSNSWNISENILSWHSTTSLENKNILHLFTKINFYIAVKSTCCASEWQVIFLVALFQHIFVAWHLAILHNGWHQRRHLTNLRWIFVVSRRKHSYFYKDHSIVNAL